MRKETETIATAFILGQPKACARTQTDGQAVYLHGNLIAKKVTERYTLKGFILTLAGWPTVTTRERLNGILNILGAYKAGFFQRNGKQFFTDLKGNEREIDANEEIFLSF